MKKRLLATSLIFLIVSNNVVADVNAVSLTKGAPAPFTGVLLSDSYAKEVYKELHDLDKYKLLNESLQKSITLYQDNEKIYLEEITQLRDENLTLNTAVSEAKGNSFWVKALWFGIGFILSGAVVYETTRH